MTTNNEEETPSPRIVSPRTGKIALLGYSHETIQAAQRLGREFIAVVPPGFGAGLWNKGIEAVEWDFDRLDEHSGDLYPKLKEAGASVAVALYEETVEWAGALNAKFRDDPRVFNRSLLLRDKAMMKRKAQMSGIRVGVFEELDNAESGKRFFRRIQSALSHLEGEEASPIHIKPTRAAGSVGHHVVRSEADIDELPENSFPCMAESHLDGQEFSCEAFVHNGKLRFLNINEYVHLGYSQFSPAGHELEEVRANIKSAVEHLISALGIQYGVIHPEYFLDASGALNFGEVAHRVPGGHIFELIGRAYGFDPFEGLLLCADPETTEEEFAGFFPDEKDGRIGYSGNVMVYPQRETIAELAIPSELLDHPYFERHSMYEPITSKVAERVGFGNHYGTIYFFGDDPAVMAETLTHFEGLEYYK